MILYWSSLHIALVCCLPGLSPSEIERYGASFVRFKDPDGPEMHKDPCNLGSAKKSDGNKTQNVCYVRFFGERLEHYMWTCRNLNRNLNFSVLSLLFCWGEVAMMERWRIWDAWQDELANLLAFLGFPNPDPAKCRELADTRQQWDHLDHLLDFWAVAT